VAKRITIKIKNSYDPQSVHDLQADLNRLTDHPWSHEDRKVPAQGDSLEHVLQVVVDHLTQAAIDALLLQIGIVVKRWRDKHLRPPDVKTEREEEPDDGDGRAAG
jgi:hypothetical protein